MTRAEVYEKLTEIFRDNFDDETIILSDDTTANDIDGWDSLEQINLVVAITDEFHVSFSVSEVGKMKNVGEMVNFILSKVNG